MQQIIIEGDIAKIVQTEVIAQAPVSSITGFLERRLPTTFPLLPDHTRLAAFDPETKRGMFLVEHAPLKTAIQLHEDRDEERIADIDRPRFDNQLRAVFNVLFPYQYFAYPFQITADHEGRITQFYLGDIYLYWAPNQITTYDDPLWYADLNNIDSDARVCWGQTTTGEETLSRRIDAQVKTFAATVFNGHLGMHPAGYDSFTEWEALAANPDPLAYSDLPLFAKPPETTVRAILERHWEGDPPPIAADRTNQNFTPPPPGHFTLTRAREWAAALDPNQRRLFLNALSHDTPHD